MLDHRAPLLGLLLGRRELLAGLAQLAFQRCTLARARPQLALLLLQKLSTGTGLPPEPALRLIRGPQVGRETLKLRRLLLPLPLSLAETAF